MLSGRGDTCIHSFELCDGSQYDGNSDDKLLEGEDGGGWGLFPTTSRFELSGGVTSGIALIPQTYDKLDVMKCEVARILRWVIHYDVGGCENICINGLMNTNSSPHSP